MNKEFIPYEQALALKELGFDEPCLASYYRAGKRLDVCEYIKHGEYTILAPTWSQAFRWFRKEYCIDSYIRPNLIIDTAKSYQFNIEDTADDFWFETHEEAELACLKKLIEIANEQQ
jgi:hypothetical protein